MECRICTDRIGRCVSPVVHSVELKGAPFNDRIKLILDFVEDESGISVSVIRHWIRGKKSDTPRRWALTAIKNRDSKGLEGFADFAKKVCEEDTRYPGAALASIIFAKATQIPKKSGEQGGNNDGERSAS